MINTNCVVLVGRNVPVYMVKTLSWLFIYDRPPSPHVIIRGIERTVIFRDDKDRDAFLDRLGGILLESSTPCYVWPLLSNHAHFLLRTGRIPTALVMRRLLTGYAVTFNRRYGRHGHLFQNRYKSILCDKDAYLQELVRYIHLNALRAGLVKDLGELGSYAYSGHCVLMGKKKRAWQDRDYVLRYFGQTEREAKLGISPSGVSKSIERAQQALWHEDIVEHLLESQ
ncbi:MAG: hypothetical protein ABIL06_15600 [Pseudomonadota bacterium]